MMNRIVLDTNCLIASISRRGNYYEVWASLQKGRYILCVSNEILEEYGEVIARKTNELIAANVVQTLINSPSVLFVTPYYHFHSIETDKDDNKFVDCAVAANAVLVSEDAHFNVLKGLTFPQIELLSLKDFRDYLVE